MPISFFSSVVSVPKSIRFLLFSAGFAILSLEIVAVKILAPFVGLTLPVWGSILTTILLGSMIGYYLGGMVADKAQRSGFIFLFAAISGLLIMLIPLLKKVVPSIIDGLSYVNGSIAGSLFLFLPSSLMLGALITYTIRIYVRDTNTIAQVHGDLYAIATVGSILGVFGTSYLLIPFFALSHILFGLGTALILAGLTVKVSTPREVQN